MGSMENKGTLLIFIALLLTFILSKSSFWKKLIITSFVTCFCFVIYDFFILETCKWIDLKLSTPNNCPKKCFVKFKKSNFYYIPVERFPNLCEPDSANKASKRRRLRMRNTRRNWDWFCPIFIKYLLKYSFKYSQ